MSFLWDSNILRHYLDTHPRLLENLKKAPRQSILLPIVVVAEQLRGRSEAILQAEPAQLARTQELFRQTQTLVNKFQCRTGLTTKSSEGGRPHWITAYQLT